MTLTRQSDSTPMITRWSRKAPLLGASLTALLVATSCAGQGGDSEDSADEDTDNNDQNQVSQFSIIAPENESDYGWNQAGLAGAERASEETDIALDSLADAGWDNDETIFNQVSSAGNEFIIAHASGFSEAAQRSAEQGGAAVLVVDHGEVVEDTVSVLTTAAEEGAYLAGVAAALTTETDTIGMVVSADDVNWFSQAGGFAEGVYSVDTDIQVIYAQLGPYEYSDSSGGRATTDQLISAGADVILGMGDGATVGYLQAIESSDNEVHYIGTVGDVTEIMDDPSLLLTSVLWNFESAYTQALQDLEEGVYGHDEDGYVLNLENGGIGLQEGLPDEVQEEVDAAEEAIISGEIEVTRANTANDVTEIIDDVLDSETD